MGHGQSNLPKLPADVLALICSWLPPSQGAELLTLNKGVAAAGSTFWRSLMPAPILALAKKRCRADASMKELFDWASDGFLVDSKVQLTASHTINANSIVNGVFVYEDTVLAACDKNVRLFNLNTGQQLGELHTHSNYVMDILVISRAKGEFILSCSYDQTVAITDFRTRVLIRTVQTDGNCMNLREVPGPTQESVYAACGTGSNKCILIDVLQGKILRSISMNDWIMDTQLCRVPGLPRSCLAICNALSGAPNLALWDYLTNEKLAQHAFPSGIRRFAMVPSPNGKSLDTICVFFSEELSYFSFDVKSFRATNKVVISPARHDTYSCYRAGRAIITSDSSGTVLLFAVGAGNPFSPEPFRTLRQHKSKTRAFHAVRGKATLVSAGEDKNIVVWTTLPTDL